MQIPNIKRGSGTILQKIDYLYWNILTVKCVNAIRYLISCGPRESIHNDRVENRNVPI